jgi:hypothetical protein
MYRRRLFLLVFVLCCLGVLSAPAYADMCPNLSINSEQVCECMVRNYGTTIDYAVTIKLYHPNGVLTCGPSNIKPGSFINCSEFTWMQGYRGCNVTGEGSYSRTSLVVEAGMDDYSPLAAVGCN